MTIEQAIEQYGQYINFCEYQGLAVQKEELEQMTEWLRELEERRKAPEIIRCKDCKHYEWMSNRIPEEQTWHCHCWDADTGKDDFCSYAERRTE
jgi:hypothetical protein